MEENFKKYLKIIENDKRKKILKDNQMVIDLAIENSDLLNYRKPNFNYELDELQRTEEIFNIDIKTLINEFDKSKLDILSEKDWKKMENTDSYDIKNLNQLDDLLIQYDRNVERLLDIFKQIANDKIIEAPIVLYRQNKNPYLIGGNTRLSVIKFLKLKNKSLKNPMILPITI